PVSGPSNGTLTLNADGTFTYNPNLGFNGTDTFQYQVLDGNGGTDVGLVTITVTAVNDAPVAQDDACTTAEDTQLSGGNVLAHNGSGADSDADGDTLTVNTTPVSGPSNRTLTLNVDGTFTYNPNLNFSGTDTFQYQVLDGNGGTDVGLVTITVTPMNDAPVARDDAFTTAEDTPLSGGNVLANNGSGADSDADGDTLTVNTTPVSGPSNDAPVARDDAFTTAEDTQLSGGNVLANNGSGADSDPDGDTLTVNTTPVSGPSNGTLTLNADGTFTYNPNLNFSGTDTFQYQVLDGNGGTDVGLVTITVTPMNDAPVAQDDAFTTAEDTQLSGGNVLANNGSGVDSDADGDTLTVNTTPVSGPSNGTLTLNADGTFTYNPNLNFSGTDTFQYQVLDGNGGTDVGQVTITVTAVNDAPVAQDDAFTTAEDTQLSGGNVLANNG